MTLPTLAETLEIARLIVGAGFAAAAVWVAGGPLFRAVANQLRRPARPTATPSAASRSDSAATRASHAA